MSDKPKLTNRSIISMVGLIILIVAVTLLYREAKNFEDNYNEQQLNINEIAMQLTSPNFTNHSDIPVKYTCDGEDTSPALQWADFPEATKSFVLIVRDPDAPAKDEWIHWIVINIPADINEVSENSIPFNGTEVANDFGRTSWGGPCPPDGQHRYFFEVYALNVETIAGNSLEEVETAMQDHIIDKAELMGNYDRQK